MEIDSGKNYFGNKSKKPAGILAKNTLPPKRGRRGVFARMPNPFCNPLPEDRK